MGLICRREKKNRGMFLEKRGSKAKKQKGQKHKNKNELIRIFLRDEIVTFKTWKSIRKQMYWHEPWGVDEKDSVFHIERTKKHLYLYLLNRKKFQVRRKKNVEITTRKI